MNAIRVLLLLFFSSWSLAARAQPSPDDPAWLPAPAVAPVDLMPRAFLPWSAAAEGTTLSLGLRARLGSARRDLGGSVWLTVPTGRKAKHAPPVTPPIVSPRAPRRPPASPALPRRIPARAIREAVDAALEHAGFAAPLARLDDLASRARWSAALPDLRLRATRLVDESASLSPTSYDPSRTTSRDGASLWLEARSTWRLDRLLFAAEEVPLARERARLETLRRALPGRVIDLLYTWRAAQLEQGDPLLPPASCRAAWIAEQRAGASLDRLTGGWHTRFRRRFRAAVRCDFGRWIDGRIDQPEASAKAR